MAEKQMDVLLDIEDLDIQGETPQSKFNGDSWGNSSIQEENSRMVQLLGTFTNKACTFVICALCRR